MLKPTLIRIRLTYKDRMGGIKSNTCVDYSDPLTPTLVCLFFKKDENRLQAVELVGKGVRGGQREALSTASALFRRRRIIHKFTALTGSVRQLVPPWGHQARGRARSVAPFLTDNPNGCLGQ